MLVLASPVTFVLPVIHRLLRAGYGRGDIVQALRTDLDRQREELAFQFGRDASPSERIAHGIAYAGFGLVGIGVGIGLLGTVEGEIAAVTMLVGVATMLIAGLVAAHRYQRRRDRPGQRWLTFWKSRLGKWAARLAGLGLGRTPTSATHESQRAETAIANAAHRMFQDLPDGARRAVADLPDVLRRMEVQTLGIRTWIAELDASSSSEGEDATEDDVRDCARQCLAETVTSLEGMRLELRQFHEGTATGSGGVDGVRFE